MKKVFLFVCLCIVLCVPVFAETYHFTSADIQWIPLADVEYGNSYVRANDTGVYFYVQISSDDNRPVIHAVSAENNKSASLWRSFSDSTLNLTINRAWGSYYSNGSGINFDPSEWNCVYNVSAYDSDVSASVIQSDFASFLENPVEPDPNPSPGPSGTLSTFNLPRGNVAYFKVERSSDVSIVSHMSQLSYLIQFGQVYWGPWGDTGQRFGSAASLPDSSTTFPLSTQTPIIWTKDSKQTVLGQTKVGHATKSCSADTWYVFYNPDISSLGSPTEDVAGASVNLTGYFSDIKVYPLSMSLNYDSVIGGQYLSSSDDGYASYYDGTPDADGSVVWTNQDGDVEAPQIGGQNAQYGDLSTEGLIQTVQNYLANIYNEIKSLFSFGYEAIQTLVGIMSDFVNVFQGLYSWLPQPVHAALVSAISVAIVIGVFKVFL